MDSKDLHESFNSVGYEVSTGGFANEVSQLGFMIDTTIGETPVESPKVEYVSDGAGGFYPVSISNRKRFEEVFGIRKEGRVAYPGPAAEDKERSSPFYCFYKFKEEKAVWAWQEFWSPIGRVPERDTTNVPFNKSSNNLLFVNFEYMDYEFDMYKEEHRRTVEEGDINIVFSAPVTYKNDSGDYEIEKYPSVSVEGGPERYFEIDYDSYDSSRVDWKDEHSVGKAGATDDGNKVYKYSTMSNNSDMYTLGLSEEQKNDDKYKEVLWENDPNSLFDSEATDNIADAVDAGRVVTRSYDSIFEEYEKVAYNRGVIAHIFRDRLKYMPFERKKWKPEEFQWTPNTLGVDPCGYIAHSGMWVQTETTLKVIFTAEDDGCLGRMDFSVHKGTYICNDRVTGKYRKVILCAPEVEVFVGSISLGILSYELPSEAERRKKFSTLAQVVYEITPPVKAMLAKTNELIVKFRVPAGHMAYLPDIRIDHIRFEKAEYVDTSEIVKFKERRYIVSEATSVGDFNLNGPDEPCKPKLGFLNGGIYWPVNDNTPGSVHAVDKMRSIDTGTYHPTKTVISTTDILSKEEEEQKLIYEQAYALDNRDDVIYTSKLPLKMAAFLESIGINRTVAEMR